MKNLRFLVEVISNPMPAELAHHRIAMALGKLLDGRPNITQPGTGLDAFNTFLQGFLTNRHQFFRFFTR